MKRSKPCKRKIIMSAVMLIASLIYLSGCASNKALDDPAEARTGPEADIEIHDKLESTPTPTPTPAPELSTAELPEQAGVEFVESVQADPDALQIVFFGDANLDKHRNESGIPYLVGKMSDASVYNLGLSGSSISMEPDEPTGNEDMNSTCLVAVSLMLNEKVSTVSIKDTAALETMANLDAANTDYFVIMYGVNDFTRSVPLSSEVESSDITTYVGALRVAVGALHDAAPGATVVICSPYYAQFYEEGSYVGDGNILDNSIGATLYDYKGICEYVAGEAGALFINAYSDLGIDGYTADKYLEEGIYLSEEGRALFAEYLSTRILAYEETKNN